MIPVNICSQDEIGPGPRHRPILKPNRFGQFPGAFSSDGRDFAPAQYLGRDEREYLINDSRPECVESQIWPAFQQKALNFTAIELADQALEVTSKNKRIAIIGDTPPAVHDDAQQGPPPWETATVGQLGFIGDDRSAARDQRIDAMTKVVNGRSRFLRGDP